MKPFLLHSAARRSSGGGDVPSITELHEWINSSNDVPLGTGLIGDTDTNDGRQYIHMPVPETGKWFFGIRLLASPEFSYALILSWNGVFANIDVTPAGFTASDIAWLAYDGDNQQAWMALNDGDWNDDPAADPASGIGGLQTTQNANRPINTVEWTGHERSQVMALVHPPQWTRAAPAGFLEMAIDGEYA